MATSNLAHKPKRLGAGAYGHVYQFSSDTAIKRFICQDGDGVGLCLRENEILSKINHPHIIGYRGMHEGRFTPDEEKKTHDCGYHILMEKADDTVHQRIKEGKLKYVAGPDSHVYLKDIRECITHILLALEYLELNGIYHRDISYTNVLFKYATKTTPKMYKLCDFGMWRHYNAGTSAQGDYVNIESRGPEMFTNQHYGYGVDIWPVGVMMYSMLVGSNPLIDRTNTEWETNPYVRAAAIMRAIPRCPHKEIHEWVTRMRGVSYAGITPTDAQSDAGEKLFLKTYTERKSARSGAWSKIKDEATVIFLSRLLTWHIGNRPTATQLLNDPYLFDDFGEYITSIRQQHLKKDIIFPCTIKIPPAGIRRRTMADVISQDIIQTIIDAYAPRDVILGLTLYCECIEALHSDKYNMEAVLMVCFVIANKWNCTNFDLCPYAEMVTPEVLPIAEEIELAVLKYFKFYVGRITLYDEVSRMYTINTMDMVKFILSLGSGEKNVCDLASTCVVKD